ncbi:hypothetical protein PUR61_36165 [Streptomyces sp. BE20]|uniref:hypothetical protein n=1 Tax=Streptomyces sp. BE20 TaxID=3002525 RepID=UPI002E7AA5F3|nr:hypothetical protein [Streptomyces sp. BE20]MEE1827576.1 hypothetical protein [Streptomyces sp. BE20]
MSGDTVMSDDTVAGSPSTEPHVAPAAGAPSAGEPSAERAPAPPLAPSPEPVPSDPLALPSVSRRLLRATGATVAAALVGVVIGVGIIEVRYDDPAPVAAAAPAPAPPTPGATPTPFGAKSNGNHFGSLRDLLLPVPSDYGLGPDEGGYGNDVELTAAQLSAELDELLQVPKEQQEKLRAYWEGLHVKATGIRTYAERKGGLVIGMRLRQFNQQEVQRMNEYTAVFTGDTGLFRTGPAVPGHPEAHCYLMPAPPSAPIDYLECSAAEGDLLVVMSVEGVAPLPKDKIVAFLAQQLDRLATPGASA